MLRKTTCIDKISGAAMAGVTCTAIVLMLTGCGGAETKTTKATAIADCAKSASGDPTTPIVALLRTTGRADKTTGDANDRAIQKVLTGAQTLKANLLINGIDGTASPPNLRLNTQMEGTGNNNLLKQKNLDCKVEAAQQKFAGLDKEPSNGRLDNLSALRSLKRDLDGKKPKEIHIVMLAPATQTETVNLLNGETLDNPATAINRLAAGQLNFSCPRWRVYVIGTNRTRNGNPVSAATDVKLKAWWSAYFARCGGALVTWNNELATFPLGPNQTEGADNRRIPVSIKHAPREIVATIGGDLLFDTGSARLRPGADQGLNRVLPLLGQAEGPITVTGHTDNTGSDALNDRLSRERAQTVATWLQQRSGLPADRLHVTGRGSHQPIATNTTTAGKAKNRRVVVAIQIVKPA